MIRRRHSKLGRGDIMRKIAEAYREAGRILQQSLIRPHHIIFCVCNRINFVLILESSKPIEVVD